VTVFEQCSLNLQTVWRNPQSVTGSPCNPLNSFQPHSFPIRTPTEVPFSPHPWLPFLTPSTYSYVELQRNVGENSRNSTVTKKWDE